MSHIGIWFEAIVECPKCSSGVPINGAAESLSCSNCQHVVAMPLRAWVEVFGYLAGHAVDMPEGEITTSTHQVSGRTYKTRFGHVPPRCTLCEQNLASDVLVAAAEVGTLVCPVCEGELSVRTTPEWMREVHPLASLLVGETLPATKVAPDGGEPLQLHCVSCGAVLEVDGSARTVPCGYCEESTYIPDAIWVRIHPASTREPWLLCLAKDDAVGIVPQDCSEFVGLAAGRSGTTLLAYTEDRNYPGGGCCLAAADLDGRLRWIQREITFGEDAQLHSSAGGDLLVLIDPGTGYRGVPSARIVVVDPRSGDALGAVDCRGSEGDHLPPAKPRPPDLQHVHGACVDADGTLVVLQRGSREWEPTLLRFDRCGKPVALWPSGGEDGPRPQGLFARVLGKGKSTVDSLGARVEPAVWGQLPHRLAVPPDDVQLAAGVDGRLYLVDRKGAHLAAYERNGQLAYERDLAGLEVKKVHGVAADAGGTVHLLFACARRWKGSTWSHVARARPGEAPELWLGPLAPDSPSRIGEHDHRLDLDRDGVLRVGYGLESLRVIAADGTTLGRSPKTVRYDRLTEDERSRG